MRTTLTRINAIKYVIGIIAALIILSVFPCNMWHQTETYGTPIVSGEKAEVVNYRNYMTEVFVANGTHLQNVRLYMAEGTYDDDVTVTLYDGTAKLLATQKALSPDWTYEGSKSREGYIDVLMDVDTVPGDLYIIKFESMQSVYIGLEDWLPESGVMVVPYYNETPIEGKALTLDFEYSEPYSIQKKLFVIGVVLFIVILLIAVAEAFAKKNEAYFNKIITVERVVKFTLNPIVCVLLIVCLIGIFTGKVSTFMPDNIFALIATILLGVVLFFAINHKREGNAIDVNGDFLREHLPDFIQSLGFAYAIQGCCSYVSALYDINHYVAERKEMIGFAIAIIAMFSVGEIFNLYNLIYVIAASIAGVIYYYKNITDTMTPDEHFVIKGNVIIAILLGFILIRTIKGLVAKKLLCEKVTFSLYSLIIFIYFALIIIFRNTRWWTVTLAVSFTLLFINYGMWNKKQNFLTNVVRASVIQFVLVTIWCLLYRPYATFGCARYTHFFHTETVTATYLTMVSVVVLVMILTKMFSGITKLRDVWKELILFGVVISYLLFTMARTAIAAVFVAFSFLFIMFTIRDSKVNGSAGKACKKLLNTIIGLVIALIVMLPITFEMQRTIPCLVSKPFTYDIDEYQEEVLRGRQLSSSRYMLVGSLANLFVQRVFGYDGYIVPTYYNEKSNYDEYHATLKEMYEAAAGYRFTEFEINDEEWDNKPNGPQLQAYIDRFEYQEEILAEYTTEETEESVNVSEEDIVEEAVSDNNTSSDYTNGRLDIYRAYIEQLNMTGHDTMSAVLYNGELATHAHDVYIQVAFDHGIPVGIVFVIFGFSTFILSIVFFIKKKDKYDALCMGLTLAFAVAGIVEWVYHLGHPMSFVMLLTFTTLIFKSKTIKEI